MLKVEYEVSNKKPKKKCVRTCSYIRNVTDCLYQQSPNLPLLAFQSDILSNLRPHFGRNSDRLYAAGGRRRESHES